MQLEIGHRYRVTAGGVTFTSTLTTRDGASARFANDVTITGPFEAERVWPPEVRTVVKERPHLLLGTH